MVKKGCLVMRKCENIMSNLHFVLQVKGDLCAEKGLCLDLWSCAEGAIQANLESIYGGISNLLTPGSSQMETDDPNIWEKQNS